MKTTILSPTHQFGSKTIYMITALTVQVFAIWEFTSGNLLEWSIAANASFFGNAFWMIVQRYLVAYGTHVNSVDEACACSSSVQFITWVVSYVYKSLTSLAVTDIMFTENML